MLVTASNDAGAVDMVAAHIDMLTITGYIGPIFAAKVASAAFSLTPGTSTAPLIPQNTIINPKGIIIREANMMLFTLVL